MQACGVCVLSEHSCHIGDSCWLTSTLLTAIWVAFKARLLST